MDKTIEVILVATVALIVASIAIFMARGQADSFSSFLGGETQSAKCDYWTNQWKSAEQGSEKRQELEGKMSTAGCSFPTEDDDSGTSTDCSGLSESTCGPAPGCTWTGSCVPS